MLKKHDIISKIEQFAGECSSLKELAEKTGFGRKTLRDVFAKNAMLKNRIMGRLKDFADDFEEVEFPEGNRLIVLDTSTIHATNLLTAIDIAIDAGFTFVLTSITIKELDAASSKKDEVARLNAQRLLSKAVKDAQHIIPVDIPECSVNPDDDILEAIKGNKENIILWTGDKAMLLKARMYKIRNVYIEEEIKIPKDRKPQETMNDCGEEETQAQMSQEAPKNEDENIRTIFGAKIRKDGNLYLSRKVNPYTTSVELYDVFKRPKKLTDALEIGDSIITVIIKPDFSRVRVREEKVTRITKYNNSMLIFEKCVYDVDNLSKDLPEKYLDAVSRFLI